MQNQDYEPKQLLGHPTLEELMKAQGTKTCEDPRTLIENGWPKEENFEEFLQFLHETRGHKKSDPAA